MSDIKNKLPTIIDRDENELVVPCIDIHLVINKKLKDVSTLIDTIYTSFLNEFDDDFTFCAHSGKRFKATRIQKEKLNKWLKDEKKLKTLLLGYRIFSAKNAKSTEAAPYFFFFYDATYNRNIIKLRLSYPIDYPINLIKKFINNVLKDYPVTYGYGGYSLSFDLGFTVHKPWIKPYTEMLKNYPGLVFSELLGFSQMIVDHNKIPIVNWLTILGEPFINAMGGINKIKDGLSNHFEFIELNDTLYIFAGEAPKLGNKTASSLPLYQEIGKFLKPISAKEFPKGVAGMEYKEGIEWHMRFFK